MPGGAPPYNGPKGPFGEDFNTKIPAFITDIFTFVKDVHFENPVPKPGHFNVVFTFETLVRPPQPVKMAVIWSAAEVPNQLVAHGQVPGSGSLSNIPLSTGNAVLQGAGFNMEQASQPDNQPITLPFKGSGAPSLGKDVQFFSEISHTYIDTLFIYRWKISAQATLDGTVEHPGKVVSIATGWSYGIQAIDSGEADGYLIGYGLNTGATPPTASVGAPTSLFHPGDDYLLGL